MWLGILSQLNLSLTLKTMTYTSRLPNNKWFIAWHTFQWIIHSGYLTIVWSELKDNTVDVMIYISNVMIMVHIFGVMVYVPIQRPSWYTYLSSLCTYSTSMIYIVNVMIYIFNVMIYIHIQRHDIHTYSTSWYTYSTSWCAYSIIVAQFKQCKMR